jgi:hydrogenase maturation protein HypF
MQPYTPLHHLLLAHDFTALVMTSANRSDEPICIANDDAVQRLADIADGFLVHDRDIYLRSDDSIVRFCQGATRFVRRSRGYVPVPVFLHKTLPPILACGAELKNTICLTRGDHAFVSQHIGDLENVAALDFFKMTIDHLRRILDIAPAMVACDLHPDYLSTTWARAQKDLPVIGVQHHHAHMAACMAENRLDGPVVGLCLDGTGYGSDGAIWGGEVLVGAFDGFQRVGHLAYAPMPGGAAAIKEPWRMALSHLMQALGDGFADSNLPFLQTVEADRLAFVARMVQKQVNCPLTSSLGRLFDAVAALCGLRQNVSFEGQAAMELEMVAATGSARPYAFDLDSTAEICRIMPQATVAAIARDLAAGVPSAMVSARFHATVIAAFGAVVEKVARVRGLKQVVLSGGSFQNAILLSGFTRFLTGKGLAVFSHSQVPCNDGGICLGQAMVAGAKGRAKG